MMNDDVLFCCTVSLAFFFHTSLSSSLYFALPSRKYHFLVQNFVCAMFQNHGSSHSLSSHYQTFL